MTKTKKIILLSFIFICLSGIIYSCDFQIKSFLALAADSIKTAKSVYEQGEQIRIIVEPNSEYAGCRMYIKEPTGDHAHFFVLPEIPAKGGTYYGKIPSNAPLGTWTLVLQEVSEEGGVITGGDKFYPVSFEVVKKGEGTKHEDIGPIDEECVPPDDANKECWYREHPECPWPNPDTPEEDEEADEDEEDEEDDQPTAEECPPSPPQCQLFYIQKEKTNKCIGTLKGSKVYESEICGQKVESMIIMPGI